MKIELQAPITPDKPTQSAPPAAQQTDVEQADNSSASTPLQLSETSLSLSAATKTKPTAEIDSNEKAQALVLQFQKDAAKTPSLTESAQSINATSQLVSSLIG